MAKKKNRKKKLNSNLRFDFNTIFFFLLFIFVLFLLFYNFDAITKFVIEKQNETTIVNVKNIEEKKNVLDAIVHTKELLSVTDGDYSNSIKKDHIRISMGVPAAEMDLNYANMILTGQVELTEGTILSGHEFSNGNRQKIEIIDDKDSQKYIVYLYYVQTKEKNLSKTKLAIIVDDFGINNGELLDAFCSLDKNVNFAILPDQRYTQQVMEKAREHGHEMLIHIPMEPISYPKNNPGKNAIYVHQNEKKIKNLMEHFIEQLPYCVGANNHMGSLVTTDERVMKTVISVLKKHELYFIDSRTTQSSLAYKVAKELLLPAGRSNLFLDTPEISPQVMETKLSQLQMMAKSNDKLIVITHCATWERYKYLKEFISKIKNFNFELVPVSNILKKELPEIL